MKPAKKELKKLGKLKLQPLINKFKENFKELISKIQLSERQVIFSIGEFISVTRKGAQGGPATSSSTSTRKNVGVTRESKLTNNELWEFVAKFSDVSSQNLEGIFNALYDRHLRKAKRQDIRKKNHNVSQDYSSGASSSKLARATNSRTDIHCKESS